jgi:hypothetical protein
MINPYIFVQSYQFEIKKLAGIGDRGVYYVDSKVNGDTQTIRCRCDKDIFTIEFIGDEHSNTFQIVSYEMNALKGIPDVITIDNMHRFLKGLHMFKGLELAGFQNDGTFSAVYNDHIEEDLDRDDLRRLGWRIDSLGYWFFRFNRLECCN